MHRVLRRERTLRWESVEKDRLKLRVTKDATQEVKLMTATKRKSEVDEIAVVKEKLVPQTRKELSVVCIEVDERVTSDDEQVLWKGRTVMKLC